MLLKTFAYLAGTGRTGTHWVQRLIQATCDRAKVVTFHDSFPKRAKTAGRHTPVDFWQNYLLNLMASNRDASVYVECNPALLEHVALTYGIRNAVSAIPGGMLPMPTRGVWMVRHPFGYVASLKARGYGWKWWAYPHARDVYGIGDGFTSRPIVERAALAWVEKNQFCASLVKLDVPIVSYELLFESATSQEDFTAAIERILDTFGLEPLQPPSVWWELRSQRAAGKAKGSVTLTAAEQETVKRICAGTMEALGYE